MAPPRRRAGERRGSRLGLRPGVVLSALLHLGFAALAVFASLSRGKPPEPLPPPAYAVEFEGGAPDRPAEPEASPSSPPDVEEAPQNDPPQEAPAPAVAAVEPPAREVAQAPVEEPAPPPPPRPDEARTTAAEADPPLAEDLPIPPPPPAPPQPQREAALTAPPRPARPPPSEPLPGLYLPDARDLQPPRPAGPRRGLDLSPGQLPRPGRDSPAPEASVRGAQVGPDWRNALRQWWEDHKRYPEGAAVLGEEGTTRVELIVDPDGRVRSARLLRRSGSVWLDAGTMSLFRGAKLPPFPAGADPGGVVVDWTINYRIIR